MYYYFGFGYWLRFIKLHYEEYVIGHVIFKTVLGDAYYYIFLFIFK